jgi:hypothetical protein
VSQIAIEERKTKSRHRVISYLMAAMAAFAFVFRAKKQVKKNRAG